MLIIKNGDLLKAEEKYLLHQVNCQNKMRSGIAKQILNKYPEVFQAYTTKCLNTKKENLLGQILNVKTHDGKIVCNIFGQFYYGTEKRQTSYPALFKALCNIVMNVDSDIALPYRLGCGLAGGDWNKVYKFLEIIAEDFKYNIVIYKFE